jgi:hypothetical protein
MVEIATAIKHHCLDTKFLGFAGDGLTYEFAFLRLIDFLGQDILFPAGCTTKCYTAYIINQLRIDIAIAPEDVQPWALCSSRDLVTNPVPDILSPENFCVHIFKFAILILPESFYAIR